jgi:hypothetical protein
MHVIEPVKDSWYLVGKSLPANLLNAYDYPVEALCRECGGRIVSDTKFSPWKHEERQ